MAEVRKRKCYDFKFKQAVIKHAEETNNWEAVRKYSVDESMVRRWRKIITSDSSAALTQRKQNFGGGTKPVLGDLEEDLLERIIDKRERHLHVPCKLITTWALEIAEKDGIKDFQASFGWLFRFLKRGNLSIRRRTTTDQMMPKDALSKIANSIKFCKKQRQRFKFSLSHVANMDETPIWADIPSATTVDMKGSKVVPIKTTGHKKQCITVCLAVKADGTKIKPFVVLPSLKVRPKVAAINGAIVKCSKNGWMNDELTAQWVDEVWGSFAFEQRFLVWDSFKCHVSEDIKEHLCKMKTTMRVIPAGCRKFLQPLDVSINKPFKSFFREYYNEWYHKDNFEYTKGGIIKPPSHELQVKWVVESWKKIEKDIMVKSFDSCGITCSDLDKIHCLSADQPTEEARVLLNDRNEDLECVAQATLHDSDYDDIDTVRIEDETDLTEQIIQDGFIEISAI